ncbi:hypothetical protein EXIGLDRAFT_771664 [Exidia glandulosa HHB12029]|uniref:CHAT domain-containing protein n=1 Tax=Exidia glandulosa HHB12029 TaxID=1314781 RepID=A0A165FUB8_EXIGL|nr:hypothetical protein EXIGLDRAFT_771664 [Exidia glandulosa HHB12029]
MYRYGCLDALVFQTAHSGTLTPEEKLVQLGELDSQMEVIDYPRGQLNALSEIARIAHARGHSDVFYAACALQRELAERLSLRLQVLFYYVRDLMGAAMLSTGHFDRVVEGFDWALGVLDGAQLYGLEAMFLQVYGFIHIKRNLRNEAIRLTRAAYDLFLKHGTPQQVSTQAIFVGQALLLMDDVPLADRADAYVLAREELAAFAEWDEAHGIVDNRWAQYTMLIIIEVMLRFADPEGSIIRAKSWLTKAEAMQDLLTLVGIDPARFHAALSEMRALIALLENDDILAANAAIHDALVTYADLDMQLYLANSFAMAAMLRIRAYHQQRALVYLNDAQTLLEAAHKRYARQDELSQVPVTLYYLAVIHAERWKACNSPQDLTDAMSRLSSAHTLQERMRRELSALSRPLALRYKSYSASHTLTRDILNLAYSLSRESDDVYSQWRWMQRSKARGLSDMLGLHATISAQFIADLDVDARGLLDKEAEVAEQIASCSPPQKYDLRRLLADIETQMRARESFRNLFAVRYGEVPDDVDVPLDAGAVYLDWFADKGGHIVLFVKRPDRSPSEHQLSMTMDEVQHWKDEFLDATDLEHNPRCLRRLTPLIEPISRTTEPGELVVLAPYGHIHGIPLHAIPLQRAPLLQRNPVVYSASITVTAQCLARAQEQKASSSAFFGIPEDRPGALLGASELAVQFHTTPTLRNAATVAAFKHLSRTAGLLYFHGHAEVNSGDSRSAQIQLHDGPLSTTDILDLSLKPCDIAIIACGSGRQEIAAGDEPSGFIPALLVAGATSVVATLWPMRDADGYAFSKLFYESFHNTAVVDLARSLQRAALSIRAEEATSSPFFWAPFVLHGAWTRVQAS